MRRRNFMGFQNNTEKQTPERTRDTQRHKEFETDRCKNQKRDTQREKENKTDRHREKTFRGI